MKEQKICPLRLLAWETTDWEITDDDCQKLKEGGSSENLPICIKNYCAWYSTNGCVFLGIETLLGELANDVGCIRFGMEKKGG